MKNTGIRTLFPLVASLLVMTSCGIKEQDPASKDDPTKVNIHVGNLDTGYGTKWLENAARRYEELHQNDVYGDKTGVKITVDSTKDSVYPRDASSVLSDNIDIHFRENMNIDSLINSGALMDLTSVLTSENEYDDNKTIISKFYDDDKELYTKDSKVYAAPLYSGSYGIVYNKDIFEENNLYIRSTSPDNPTDPDQVKLVINSGNKKSKGYDGISGTYDDGLPCTYVEFMKVIDECYNRNLIPIGWTSDYGESYLNNFLISAFSSAAGYNEAKLRFSFNGVSNSLGKIYGGNTGEFVLDDEPTTITNNKNGNGYEMMRSKGIFDTLSFYEMIVGDDTNYLSQDSSFDHEDMQDYMMDGIDGNSVAMCVDGSWFLNELNKHYSDKSAIEDSRFGFMPIPRASFETSADHEYTFTEEVQSCLFVKSNISDQYRKAVALDFVKFFYSDSELIHFLKDTQCVIGVKYPEIVGEELDEIGEFGKGIYEMTKNSHRINVNYPNDFFLNNRSQLSGSYFFKASESLMNPIKAIANKTETAKSYFIKMGNYFNQAKWRSLS